MYLYYTSPHSPAYSRVNLTFTFISHELFKVLVVSEIHKKTNKQYYSADKATISRQSCYLVHLCFSFIFTDTC